MSYQDLFVHVDNGSICEKRLRTAVGLASRLDTHLTGLYVRPDIDLSLYENTPSGESLLQGYQNQLDRKELESKHLFHSLTAQYDIALIWRAVTGDTATQLTQEARCSDLIVLSNTDVVDTVILKSGRPCLIVPETSPIERTGLRPLIAWNASRESSRALHDALPLLKQAESVTVMSSYPDSDEGADTDNARLNQHLQQHGIDVETKIISVKDSQLRDTFLSAIEQGGHDLLVMGAYGSPRLKEIVLGGMTRDMLSEMTTPVLMSH